MMDVTVASRSLGHAEVRIDLGRDNTLIVYADYETDRYRNIRVVWEAPAHVIGKPEEIRDLARIRLALEKLDFREGKVVAHD